MKRTGKEAKQNLSILAWRRLRWFSKRFDVIAFIFWVLISTLSCGPVSTDNSSPSPPLSRTVLNHIQIMKLAWKSERWILPYFDSGWCLDFVLPVTGIHERLFQIFVIMHTSGKVKHFSELTDSYSSFLLYRESGYGHIVWRRNSIPASRVWLQFG